MRSGRAWLVLFCLLLIPPASKGFAESDISSKVEVDRAFATIGDRINFRVTIIHKPDVTILELDARPVLDDFEIKEATNFSHEENEKIFEGKNYVLTNYALGEYVIRPFKIQYRLGQSEVKELETNSLYLTIESVDKNKDPASDIRGVKGVQKIKGAIWFWLALIGFLLIGAGIVALYLHKRKGGSELGGEEILSAHDEAFQALSRLQHSDLIRKGQVKLYFFHMSEILRRYFERRYRVKALESTTYELMEELKNHLSAENAQLINEVLLLSDLVKFAKYDPPPIEILRQNNQAKLIVDRTKEEVVETLPTTVKGK